MKQRWLYIILAAALVLLLLYPATAFAAEKTLPSGIRDEEIGGRIQTYIEEHKDTTAAVAAAVFRGQDTLYTTIYGYSDIEGGLAANDETVFEWGSVTKLLVWVSVMQLWEQERIDLETDVSEYLPDGFFTRLKYDAPITMLNLMNHNAGWQETVLQVCAADAGSVLPLGAALKASEPAQIYEPGTVCAYSNWGAALAGYIVEQISGQPFYAYVQDNIFAPLGMTHTALAPGFTDNRWVLSKAQETKGYMPDLTMIEGGGFYLNLYPAGSAAGTLGNLLTFAQALVPDDHGATPLFKNIGTLGEMYSPTLRYTDTDIAYVCHGFWTHELGVQTLGHGGNTGMSSSYLMVNPSSGVGMVIMANQYSEIVYNTGLPQIVFGGMTLAAPEDDNDDVSEMTGLYYNARTMRKGFGKMYTLLCLRILSENRDGNPALTVPGSPPVEARLTAPNTLLILQQAGDLDESVLARYSQTDGTGKISMRYGDMVQADADVWACVVAAVLLGIAVLWSTAVLLIGFIRFAVRRIRKRERKHDHFKKYQVILCAAVLLLIVNIVWAASLMFSQQASAQAMLPNVIASIVLSVLPVVYAILLAVRWRGIACGRLQKAAYIITLCMGFFMTYGILVFEMYTV